MGKMWDCRQCGGRISIWASGCPYCGATGVAAYGPASCVVFLALMLLMLGLFGVVLMLLN